MYIATEARPIGRTSRHRAPGSQSVSFNTQTYEDYTMAATHPIEAGALGDVLAYPQSRHVGNLAVAAVASL